LTFARALAESHARGRLRTLFIEADIGGHPDPSAQPGWSDLLAGRVVEPQTEPAQPGIWVLPAGTLCEATDRTVTAPMVRHAIDRLSRSFDVIVASSGSLADRLACQFMLAAADAGVLALRPADDRAAVLSQIDRLDTLPRNGSVAALREALPRDPGLARTARSV
jgi:hypothetical protein